MSDRYGGQPAPAPARPGPVLGTAVLAFVQAGLLLALVVVVPSPPSPAGLQAAASASPPWSAWSPAGLDLLGGLLLLRRAGRTVLLVTALVEAGLVGLLLLVAVVDVAVRRSADPLADLRGAGPADPAGPPGRAPGADVPARRRRLARRPAATRPAAGVVAAGWVGEPGPAQAIPTGLLTAALAPVAVLAMVATVTLALSAGSVLITDGPGAGYRGTGEPTDPPAPVDRDHDSRFAGLAADCRDGDMRACDDLYFRTPVGNPYETHRSTCGGRLDDGASGGCVAAFGPTD